MIRHTTPQPRTFSSGWLALSFLAGLGLCWLGLQDMVAEWQPDLALAEGGWLLLALVLWFAPTGSAPQFPTNTQQRNDSSAPPPWSRVDACALLGIGGLALVLAIVTGRPFDSLPPAYHDEFSYLFQAQSILQGRWTWPSHPDVPELFDQMHLLNEGRMASRYYPGTGTWLAPWLAVGHPYWGQWLAGALAAGLVYAIGRDLDGRLTGVAAGVSFAAAPGPALFSNLLLAHHPTLLALMVFLSGFVRGRRTGRIRDFLMSGFGLGYALLCRPATAAGFGLPFGIWCLILTARGFRMRRNRETSAEHPYESDVPDSYVRAVWLGYGLPLLACIAVAVAYNVAATGNWRTSPYQLYTDIYTPRHVYGLNNVVRGEQKLGPKVLEDYDRWAENLTPELATTNLRNRLLITGLWTMGIPLLAITAVLSLPLLWRGDAAWTGIAWAIVSLHAIHWPYWYVGIMGWHYVFETAPLWCLLLGRATSSLVMTWLSSGRKLLVGWWPGLILLAWAGMYLDLPEVWQSRWSRGVSAIAYPRQQHAAFREWVEHQVGDQPAIVLVDQSASNPHLDLVVNDAGLKNRVLYGRYRPGQTDLAKVIAAFPERQVFLARPSENEILPLRPQ